MSRTANEQRVRAQFAHARPFYATIAADFVTDPDRLVDDAAQIFERMIPEMAYVDTPDAPMASAVVASSALLALYLALQEQGGVEVHQFGGTMLRAMRETPRRESPPDAEAESAPVSPPERQADLAADAAASQATPTEGEFVYELIVGGEDDDFESGMNVLSCAICHAFAKYDAMELVPYMCATDDVVSDRRQQGLRRRGTIALGASHCDFRFAPQGEPLPLVNQYPEPLRGDGK